MLTGDSDEPYEDRLRDSLDKCAESIDAIEARIDQARFNIDNLDLTQDLGPQNEVYLEQFRRGVLTQNKLRSFLSDSNERPMFDWHDGNTLYAASAYATTYHPGGMSPAVDLEDPSRYRSGSEHSFFADMAKVHAGYGQKVPEKAKKSKKDFLTPDWAKEAPVSDPETPRSREEAEIFIEASARMVSRDERTLEEHDAYVGRVVALEDELPRRSVVAREDRETSAIEQQDRHDVWTFSIMIIFAVIWTTVVILTLLH